MRRFFPFVFGVSAVGLLLTLEHASSSEASAHIPSAPCDVANPRCQAQLVEWASRATGVRGFRAPRIRASIGARMRASSEQPDRADAGDRDAQLVSSDVRSALVRLGLLDGAASPQSDGALHTHAGSYRRGQHEITLFLSEQRRRTAAGNAVLAHELIHAAQDAAGLLGRRKAGLDAELAWRARLEGEALSRSHRLKAVLEGLNAGAIGWSRMFRHWSNVALTKIAKAKAPLAVAVATLPYARGALWFDAVGADPAAWPERFADLLVEPGSGAPRAQATPTDVPGCRHDGERLGALALLAFLLPGAHEPEASAAAEALLADRLCIEADGSFQWHLAWTEDATSADHVARVTRRAAQLGLPALQQSGRRLTLSGP